MFEYVIWDFGGTLFDTYPAATRVFKGVLKEFGVDASEEEINEKLRESTSRAATYFIKKYSLSEDFLDKFYTVENHLEPEIQPPFRFARDVCLKINRNGGSNFLFSHRSNYSMTKLLKYYKMLDLFAEIVSSDNGFARKPDPQGIMYIIDKYDLERDKVITIGDREIDIESGRRADIATCLFDPFESHKKTNSDFVVSSLEQLLNLLHVCNRFKDCDIR